MGGQTFKPQRSGTWLVRIGVMGAGAVGSLVGAILSGTHEVVLVGREAHVRAINESGLRVTGLTDMLARPQASTDAAELAGCDVVLLTVKSYDTAEAAEEVALAEPRALLVSLQNGLDNGERIAEAAPGMRAALAVTSLGVTFMGPGHVHHAGAGSTQLGRFACTEAQARAAAAALTAGGLPVDFKRGMRGYVWLKGIVNHCINPLTVIHRCTNGALLEVPERYEQMQVLCEEAVEAVRAARISIPDSDPFARVEEVARLTATNRSSMLQDVERGRRTEIDSITGHIIAVGRAHGVGLPLSERVLREVKAAEALALGAAAPG